MRDDRTAQIRLIVPLFFLSGLAGLGYQALWAKAFAAAIGHEYPAALAVVTAFMGGMAAGNALIARKSVTHPKWYGWLEIVIALWGAATIFIIAPLQRTVLSILGLNPPAAFQWLVVFVVVLLALLPATVAMGATLPVVERFFFVNARQHTTGLLYGANTLGAMAGALLAAFWLMPQLGIQQSILALAFLNFLCGGAALLLVRNIAASRVLTPESSRLSTPTALRLLSVGFLGIGFEVVMLRGLAHFLENTVFTFAVILATYLAGNAAGAFIYQRTQRARLFTHRAVVFPVVAAACVISAITLRWMPDLYVFLRSRFGDSVGAVAAAELLVAVAMLLFPSACMGVTWAWLAQDSLRYFQNLGWGVAINTAGAAAAPAIFGLVVIPGIGLRGALAVIALGYAVLGSGSRAGMAAMLVLACAIPFFTSTKDLIDASGGQIISLREGVMGSVVVLEDESGARVLKFNNRFQMGGTSARIAEERQAHIPLLLHPEPKRALFIGLGTGITFSTAANYPALHADGVELVPEIAEAMPYFNTPGALRQTNLQVHIADGRRFVLATPSRYDVIVADLFHPAQDGAAFLYTREHFAAIRERLAERGLFCQWLPLFQMDLASVRIITRTFSEVFPETELWLLRFNTDTPVIGLVGWKGGYQYPSGVVESRISSNADLAVRLRAAGLIDSIRLFGCHIGEVTVEAELRANTDADPYVMFHAPAVTFRERDDPAERLLTLLSRDDAPSPIAPWAAGHSFRVPDFPRRIDKFKKARNIYLRGLARESSGDVKAALADFIESARISEDFTAGYAQAIARAAGHFQSEPEIARAILEQLHTAQPDKPVARELLDRLPK